MEFKDRVKAFNSLGKNILGTCSNFNSDKFWSTVDIAHTLNSWFTISFCRKSILSIAKDWLTKESLANWACSYPESFFKPDSPKRVGVVMAGNVPFVGFHDMLCVLLTGNIFVGKVSSKDAGLMQGLVDLLVEIEPRFDRFIMMTNGKIENFDAIIATGSDNSARYFQFYFNKYPNIIRKTRHSVAVLNGDESENDLLELASDIFTYFGLGCRSVSKLLVPNGYDFKPLMSALEQFAYLINHNKYANNYQYYRAIYLVNQFEHFDNGFILLKPDEGIGSPVGVIYYQHYNNTSSISDYINQNYDALQCIVTSLPQIPQSIPFGKSQQPKLNDYADGIDTIEFLAGL